MVLQSVSKQSDPPIGKPALMTPCYAPTLSAPSLPTLEKLNQSWKSERLLKVWGMMKLSSDHSSSRLFWRGVPGQRRKERGGEGRGGKVGQGTEEGKEGEGGSK